MMSYYLRDPLDGTITNNIVYPGVSAIFGSARRQDIGGEFAGSRKFAEILKDFLTRPEVMVSDAMTYGVDISITIQAVGNGLRTGEVFNTTKVHNPSEGKLGGMYDNGGMFTEVTQAFFTRIIDNVDYWLGKSQQEVEIIRKIGIIEGKLRDFYMDNPESIYSLIPEPVPFAYESIIKEFSQVLDKKNPYNYKEEYQRI